MASNRKPVIRTAGLKCCRFVNPWRRKSGNRHLSRLCSQRVRSNLTQRRQKLRIHDAMFYVVKQKEYFCIKYHEMLAPPRSGPSSTTRDLRPGLSGINYSVNCSSQRLIRILFALTNIQRKGTRRRLYAKCRQISFTLYSIKQIQQSE